MENSNQPAIGNNNIDGTAKLAVAASELLQGTDNVQVAVMDKRQQLIETAFALFYEHSVHGVGINQILQTSSVAKKTLYHHFASKDELVEAVVRYRDEVFFQWLSQQLSKEIAGLAGIRALFMALDDWFNQRVPHLYQFRGCFFINISAEFSDPTHVVHQLCAQHKLAIEGLIREQVAALGLPNTAVLRITTAICLLKEGAIVSAQLRGDKQAALTALSLVEQLISDARSDIEAST